MTGESVFFGEPWPEVEGWRQGQTPVEMVCMGCGKRFHAGEQGVWVVLRETDELGSYIDWLPKHRGCPTR